MQSGLNKKLEPVEANDFGMVAIPFGCQINGVSNPDNLIGDMIESVVRDEAGEFTFTLKSRVARCFVGFAAVSQTADDASIKCDVDWSLTESAGTFKVRTFGPTDTVLTSGAVTGTLTSGALTGVLTDLTVDGGVAVHSGAMTGTVTSTALTGTVTDLTGTMAGVQADPTDDLLLGGVLWVSKTTRSGRR